MNISHVQYGALLSLPLVCLHCTMLPQGEYSLLDHHKGILQASFQLAFFEVLKRHPELVSPLRNMIPVMRESLRQAQTKEPPNILPSFFSLTKEALFRLDISPERKILIVGVIREIQQRVAIVIPYRTKDEAVQIMGLIIESCSVALLYAE